MRIDTPQGWYPAFAIMPVAINGEFVWLEPVEFRCWWLGQVPQVAFRLPETV